MTATISAPSATSYTSSNPRRRTASFDLGQGGGAELPLDGRREQRDDLPFVILQGVDDTSHHGHIRNSAEGQPATQAPQLMHLSGSMVAMSLSSMLMALTGQLRLQGRSISTMAL